MAKRKPEPVRVRHVPGVPDVTLYPPGTRQDNRTWVCRGSAYGRKQETRSAVGDPQGQAAAWGHWRDWCAALAVAYGERRDGDRSPDGAALRPQRPRTVAELMAAVLAVKKPRKAEEAYYRKLERDALVGPMAIEAVNEHDLHDAARRLYPKAKGQTLNRNALTPWRTAFRYAAKQKWCLPLEIGRFDETAPPARRPKPGTAERLLRAAVRLGARDVFDWAIFIHYQGWRVTESLRPGPGDIDWEAETVRVFVSKARRGQQVGVWKDIQLHPVAIEMLKRRQADGLLEGERIWPWRDRHQLYDALDPVLLAAGLARIVGHKLVKGGKDRSRRQRKPIIERLWTPHRARHEWGSQQAERGASELDMVDTNTWTSPKSPAIYRTVTQAHRRKIIAGVRFDLDAEGPEGGERGGEGKRSA